MLNLAPIDQRDDLATKGYVDDAVGAVKALCGLSVSSNLSSAGWYRVLKHTGAMPDGSIIKFLIGRNQAGECHAIDLNVPYDYAFVNEVSSAGTNLGITKIRVTSDAENRYVDVYYALSSTCTLRVDFVAAGTIDKSRISVETLQGVYDAPSGETVLASYELTDNVPFIGSNANGTYRKYADGTLICTKTVNFGNITAGEWSAWGVWYESIAEYDAGNWPYEFIEVPTMNATQVQTSANVGVAVAELWTDRTTLKIGKTYFYRPNASPTYGVTYNFVGIGRWK